MDKAVLYIHGKGGDAEEALHYKSLFSDCDVIGLDYTAQFPWEAKEEFPLLFNSISKNYKFRDNCKQHRCLFCYQFFIKSANRRKHILFRL